jgi:hypothetical protein
MAKKGCFTSDDEYEIYKVIYFKLILISLHRIK